MSRKSATLIGFTAVLMWAVLALLSAACVLITVGAVVVAKDMIFKAP
jgi:uncharacterized membrane protein YgaE (UPF0421/DUF939 family)